MGGLVLALSLIAVSATAQQAPLPTPPNRIFPVFFDDFSSSLDDTALAIVAGAAKGLPNYKVKVTGYADQAGSTSGKSSCPVPAPMRWRRCFSTMAWRRAASSARLSAPRRTASPESSGAGSRLISTSRDPDA